ncbi:MAG: hypothetical protein L0Z73_10135, partial [Gammaproteobacteria bacterium]|nr:hypothetical protein [Gammaproteobacteria bacterium]
DNKIKNLPVVYQKKFMAGVSQLLAHKYPVEYAAENYEKAIQELYYVLLGIGTFLFLTYLGWAAVQRINFLEDGGFVYNSGLIGGVLMLAALLYSVVKRVRFFRNHIKSDTWYYLHIAFGATGAFLVILHSAFNLGSINSSVAFYCMLLVIISGALGRYLLTLFSIVLHKQYSEIRGLEPELFENLNQADSTRMDLIGNRVSKLAIRCLKQPDGILKFLLRAMAVPCHAIYFYLTAARHMRINIKILAKNTALARTNVKALKKTKKQQLRRYVFYVIKMGYMTLLENLFLHWRVLHVPLLYILAVTAAVHVVVVHMY